MNHVNWNKQLVLATTLFVLGSVVYWNEFKRRPQKEEQTEQGKKALSLKDTPIETLRIVGGGKAFLFKCADLGAKLCKPGDNSKWELEEPSKLKADDSNVGSLLSTLNNLNFTESISLTDETPEKRAALLKEYGLDPDSRKSENGRRITVKTSKGVNSLYLGLAHPIGEGILSVLEREKLEDSRVLILPSYFKTQFEHDLNFWRDKKIFSLGAHEIESFKLAGHKSNLSGERKDGQWLLKSKGEELAGDLENVDSLLSSVTYLTAKGFAAEDKKSAAGRKILSEAKTGILITLQKQQGSDAKKPAPFTITFYEKGKTGKGKDAKPEKLFVTVSTLDPVFELDPYVKDRVDKEVKELRLAKLITSMERFTAKRLEFSGKPIGTPPLVLLNKDSKWVSEADNTTAKPEKIQATLEKLSGNRIKEFLQGSAIPSGESDGLRLILGDEKSNSKRSLVFWKKDKKLFAKDLQSNRKEVFLLDDSIDSELPWDRNFFFSKNELVDSVKK